MFHVKHLAILAFLSLFALAGCVRPFNAPHIVRIEANESAFLIDQRATDAFAVEGSLEMRRDISITGYWVQTGRTPRSGHWRPTHQVLVVSRRPIEANWNGMGGNPIVRAVSRESAGFSIPLIINATVRDDGDAARYLQWFRSSQDNETVNFATTRASNWPVRQEAEALEAAINRVIFPVINDRLAELFLQVPITGPRTTGWSSSGTLSRLPRRRRGSSASRSSTWPPRTGCCSTTSRSRGP